MIMRKFILIIVGLFLTVLTFSQTASPELVSSSGNSFNNTTYQLDWSIGECITASHDAGNYEITQGFHQDRYVIITAIENLHNNEINISVFPNPTTDLISLKVQCSKRESIKYTLTDISGKVLQTEKVKSDIEQLNFSTYTNGVYFLSVRQENQLVKSFKIIKN